MPYSNALPAGDRSATAMRMVRQLRPRSLSSPVTLAKTTDAAL